MYFHKMLILLVFVKVIYNYADLCVFNQDQISQKYSQSKVIKCPNVCFRKNKYSLFSSCQQNTMLQVSSTKQSSSNQTFTTTTWKKISELNRSIMMICGWIRSKDTFSWSWSFSLRFWANMDLWLRNHLLDALFDPVYHAVSKNTGRLKYHTNS